MKYRLGIFIRFHWRSLLFFYKRIYWWVWITHYYCCCVDLGEVSLALILILHIKVIWTSAWTDFIEVLWYDRCWCCRVVLLEYHRVRITWWNQISLFIAGWIHNWGSSSLIWRLIIYHLRPYFRGLCIWIEYAAFHWLEWRWWVHFRKIDSVRWLLS